MLSLDDLFDDERSHLYQFHIKVCMIHTFNKLTFSNKETLLYWIKFKLT